MAGSRLAGKQLPSSQALIAFEAARYLSGRGIRGAKVHRVELTAPGISWVLFTTVAAKARYMVLAGERPGSWEFVSEGSGWPVP